jgi:hypothetical protein
MHNQLARSQQTMDCSTVAVRAPRKENSSNISNKITVTTKTTTTTKTWASHLSALEASRIATEAANPKRITDEKIALAFMDKHTILSNIWSRFDVHLQCDYDVAIAAVRNRCVPTDIQKWPIKLRNNIKFWKALLRYNQHIRKEEYDQYNTDSLCYYVPKWTSEKQIRSILSYHPILEGKMNFWYTILHSNLLSIDLFYDKAHPNIVFDKEFMLCAIKTDYSFYDALLTP